MSRLTSRLSGVTYVLESDTSGRAITDPRAPGANPGPFSVRSRRWPASRSSAHSGAQWRPWANVATAGVGGEVRDLSRNSAACTRLGGAVFQERRTRVWGPPVGSSGTLGRVAGAAQHRAVGDVERRTASGERGDVVDGQVGGGVGGAPVARAPVAVLATPGAEHAGAEPLPGPRAVQGVVPAAVGLPRVLSASATRAAGDDTTDRAELHPRIVGGLIGAVYSLAVLRLRNQPPERTGRPGGRPPLARSTAVAYGDGQREALTRGPDPGRRDRAEPLARPTRAHLGTRAASHLDNWTPAGILLI